MRDNINSVRQVVSTSGSVLNAITYDSFGNILSETNPADGDRFKYTGREYDAELGIYYYRARYYDPATGRFLGEDPLGFGAGDANFYRYVANRPTTLTDPSGMDWSDRVAGWIGVDNVRSWDNYLGDYRTGWFAQVSNVGAGWGDAVSFGVTSYIRQGLGYDSVVDYSGGAYTVGQVGGMINSFLIGYKAAGAAPDAYRAYLAWRAGQGYTVAGTVYGIGHSSYVLATDPQNFGFTDALGFIPLGGYVTSKGLTAARMWWRPPGGGTVAPVVGRGPNGRPMFADDWEALLNQRYGAGTVTRIPQFSTIDDIMGNPAVLAGRTPAQVAPKVGQTPGWQIETLGQGAHAGQGWVLREYGPNGPTGRMLRWHPGGGHHGPNPYWRVIGPNGDLGGIIPGG